MNNIGDGRNKTGKMVKCVFKFLLPKKVNEKVHSLYFELKRSLKLNNFPRIFLSSQTPANSDIGLAKCPNPRIAIESSKISLV